jgi:hypothetical protein
MLRGGTGNLVPLSPSLIGAVGASGAEINLIRGKWPEALPACQRAHEGSPRSS